MGSLYNFFISYSRFDAEYARSLWEFLQILGISAWFSESEILIQGRRSIEDEEILKGILVDVCEKSEYCLLLLSSHSVNSRWVMDVEVQAFKLREQKENRQMIIPVIIEGKKGEANSWIPKEYLERKPLWYQKPREVKKFVTSLMGRFGREEVLNCPLSPTKSSHIKENLFFIVSNKPLFQFSLNIGSEWLPTERKLKDVIFFIRNTENNFLLNLVVIPAEIRGDKTAYHIEKQNYFAENFLYGTSNEVRGLMRNANQIPIKSFLSEAMYLVEKVLKKLIVNYKEILGSHLYNLLGEPCFAFTYRVRTLFFNGISRKYTIVTKPPDCDNYYEFIFTTTSYDSDYRNFLTQIGRVDAIVQSLRFEKWHESLDKYPSMGSVCYVQF